MGICKIGEKKEIGGEWYQKAIPLKDGLCHGCSFYEDQKVSSMCGGEYEIVYKALERGGMECENSIWVACDPPAKTKPAKLAPKAKWAPIPATTKQTKTELIAIANKLGAENARLKNQLVKGKAK